MQHSSFYDYKTYSPVQRLNWRSVCLHAHCHRSIRSFNWTTAFVPGENPFIDTSDSTAVEKVAARLCSLSWDDINLIGPLPHAMLIPSSSSSSVCFSCCGFKPWMTSTLREAQVCLRLTHVRVIAGELPVCYLSVLVRHARVYMDRFTSNWHNRPTPSNILRGNMKLQLSNSISQPGQQTAAIFCSCLATTEGRFLCDRINYKSIRSESSIRLGGEESHVRCDITATHTQLNTHSSVCNVHVSVLVCVHVKITHEYVCLMCVCVCVSVSEAVIQGD